MKRLSSFWSASGFLSLALLGAASGAHADTFAVTNVADSGEGSLRQAILNANADANNSTIVFSNQFGQINNPRTISLTSGVLQLRFNTSIVGPGARTLTVTRGGEAQSGRIFNVQGGSVSISGLTITGGLSQGNGGAILNSATLRLGQCSLVGNTASGNGGAIYNTGNLTLARCTLANNTASNGGGLYTIGSANVNSSTFGNNTVEQAGGGFYNDGTASVADSTFARNRATTGGGVFNGNRLTLNNSIVGGNTATDSRNISGPVNAGDFNLVGDTTGTTLPGTNNVTGIGPMVNELADNGGPTDTFLPKEGSPAFDGGRRVVARDQRSTPRPIDLANVPNRSGSDGSDIGALELDTAQGGTSLVVNTLEDRTDGTCGLTDCTLREAVGASRDANSLVTFAPNVRGTLTLNGTNIDISRTADVSLTIQGPGADQLTLSGGGQSNIFEDSLGNNGTANISGLTFSGGNSANTAPGNAGSQGNVNTGQGGAINSDGLAVNISDCVFTGNRSTVYGGAIDSDGPLNLLRCIFTDNVSDRQEGAVGFFSGASSATDCTFANNTAREQGGAVGIFRDGTTVTRCTFTGNRVVNTVAGGGGIAGAIYTSATVGIPFVDCTFENNSVTTADTIGTSRGGAVFESSNPTSSYLRCTFTGNTARQGGALYLDNSSTFINCTLTGNTAQQGAAIFNAATTLVLASTVSGNGTSGVGAITTIGTLRVRNSTFSGNGDAVRMEGGIADVLQSTLVNNTRGVVGFSGGTLTVNRCTIAGNIAGLDTRGATTTLSNTLLVGNQTDLIGTATRSFNLLNATAAGAGLETGPDGRPLLKDNGGPTQTVALLPGSPVINQADPAISSGFDQRQTGFDRVVDGRADIGAFEFQTPSGSTNQVQRVPSGGSS
jgi:CSLREA domain-containing protein